MLKLNLQTVSLGVFWALVLTGCSDCEPVRHSGGGHKYTSSTAGVEEDVKGTFGEQRSVLWKTQQQKENTKTSSAFGYVAANTSAGKKQNDSAFSGLFSGNTSPIPKGKGSSSSRKEDGVWGRPRTIPVAEVDFFLRKTKKTSSDSNAFSERLSKSADLALQRAFLEIYCMDAAAAVSEKFLLTPAVFSVKGSMPVTKLKRKWDFKHNLIFLEGEAHLRSVPASFRRSDIDTRLKVLKKKVYVGTDDLSSLFACLIRQAELKSYHRVLRKYRHWVDYKTSSGKGIALELVNALTLKSYEFHPHANARVVSGKIAICFDSRRISPETAAFLKLKGSEDMVFDETISMDEN